jgi:Family of unknown function (DUF6188)
MHLTEVARPDPESLSVQQLVGQQLTNIDVSGLPNWVFHFSGGVKLSATTVWRLLASGRVEVTSEDHGQTFGAVEPEDAFGALARTTHDRPILTAAVDAVTADLSIGFTDDIRLQVLSISAGYENWTMFRPDGTQLVAMGGGRLALFKG